MLKADVDLVTNINVSKTRTFGLDHMEDGDGAGVITAVEMKSATSATIRFLKYYYNAKV